MSQTLFRRIEQSRIYDWTMRLPIFLYSLYVLVHDVISFSEQAAPDPATSVRVRSSLRSRGSPNGCSSRFSGCFHSPVIDRLRNRAAWCHE